jgi:hypothetical protein
MNGRAFDTFTKSIAHRMSRRGVIAAGGLGISAGGMSHMAPAALAQSATPVGGATPIAGEEVELLFVQTFSSATVEQSSDGSGTLTITLQDGTGQTVYFSDRPERPVGTLTDAQFLDSRAFDPADPPNAAIVALTGGTEDVLVVELLDPVLDSATGSVTYTARPLQGQPEGAVLASIAARQQDAELDPSIGPVTLFIDQLACSPDGAGCSSNSDCCNGFCCDDIEVCPPGVCT